MKVLGKNVIKCHKCGSYLEYDEADIETKEVCYSVQTYAEETYNGKFITCPKCGNKIEVY